MDFKTKTGLEALRTNIEDARRQFMFYAKAHADKGTEASHVKAQVNYRQAERMGNCIATIGDMLCYPEHSLAGDAFERDAQGYAERYAAGMEQAKDGGHNPDYQPEAAASAEPEGQPEMPSFEQFMDSLLNGGATGVLGTRPRTVFGPFTSDELPDAIARMIHGFEREADEIDAKAQAAQATDNTAGAKLNPWHPMSNPVDLKVTGKLLEELGELSAALARCVIQGIDECHPDTLKLNRSWVMDEMADVAACGRLLAEHFGLDVEWMEKRADAKARRLAEWHKMA